MEIAQSLSIESFSYSWLVNLRPSLDSLDTSLGASLDASFTEMDPTMPPSKRFFQDFNKFYFHTSQTPPPTLVHADELFADGYILPFFVNHSSPTLLATSSQREQNPDSETQHRVRCSRKCRTRLPKRIFLKYLDFLTLLFRRIRGFSSCSKPEMAYPRNNDAWRKSFDSESSIYEAVLHCKQSIGK